AQALIEKVSSERLGMHAPEPREIQVVFGKEGQ
ncbi:cell division protein FtsL, partial [Aquitalea sp. S1-19]|nr:cell division protein FtsL [Aquitalea sp. S1-19]